MKLRTKHLLFATLVSAMLALAGCSTAPKLPERVLIPVAAECPVPDVPARPTVPAAIQDKGAAFAKKARAIAVYIEQLNGHIDALTAILGGYSKKSGPQ